MGTPAVGRPVVPLSIREPTTPDRTPDPDADHTRALCQGKELLLLLLLARMCVRRRQRRRNMERTLVISSTWEMEFWLAQNTVLLRPFRHQALPPSSGTRRRTPRTLPWFLGTMNNTDPALNDFRLDERKKAGICQAISTCMPPKTGLLLLPSPLPLSTVQPTPRAPPSQSSRLPNNIGSKGGPETMAPGRVATPGGGR